MIYAADLLTTRAIKIIYSTQRRLLFAGALARQDDKRPPKRLLFAERLEGGEDPGPGQPAHSTGRKA